MASQRIQNTGVFGNAGVGFGSALNNNFYGLFDPGDVVTGMSKGDESNPMRGSAMDALQSGGFGYDAFGNSSATYGGQAQQPQFGVGNPSSQNPQSQMGGMTYAIPEWDALFGDDGAVADADALLRALNVGSLFGDWTTVDDTPYQAAATGNPMLDQWLSGLNDFNASVNAGERYFDPNNLAFTDYDLGGIDLRSATLDDLNAWAESQYGPGVDLLTVAASNPELLQARQQAYEDPSSFIDPLTGLPNVSMIPGLSEEMAAARMSAYETGMANTQQQQNQRANQEYAAMLSNLTRDPEYMRTAAGANALGTGAAQAGLMSSLPSMIPSNYEFLAATGMAPQMAESVLQQLRLQGG